MNKTCSECGAPMEELDVDFGDMAEGQQTDYEMGFHHPWACTKCGHNDVFEECNCKAEEDWIIEHMGRTRKKEKGAK